MRATHAPFVVYFLNQHFKVESNLTSPHSLLAQKLSLFLEQVHETQTDVLTDRAETYLTQWSTGDSRWLRRFYDSGHAESVYQLTPHCEDVLTFLSQVLDQNIGFVGTESRLTRIIETLANIVVRGSADAERRLEFLYLERERIETEIRAVQSGDVATHSPTAIRERFADVITDLVSLQGDFRAVEESFKSITRDVQRQQTEAAETRGSILGFALDAEDRLKEEDQGASFQAFVRLILSQNQQDSLEKLIAQLDEINELAEQTEGKHRIRGMIGSLSAEAEKVLSTTRRLSSTLRRLLDSRSSASRMRLTEVLREIQSAAAQRAESPPEVGISVHTELDLMNIHSRTFWESPVEFDDVELSDQQVDDDDARLMAFRELAEMQRLDWDTMRSNIASEVSGGARVTLAELVERHSLKSGSIELLGYIQLAHDDGHDVDETITQTITIQSDDPDATPQTYEVPRVVFVPLKAGADCG